VILNYEKPNFSNMVLGAISVMLVNKNAVWYLLKQSQAKRRLEDVLMC